MVNLTTILKILFPPSSSSKDVEMLKNTSISTYIVFQIEELVENEANIRHLFYHEVNRHTIFGRPMVKKNITNIVSNISSMLVCCI